MRYAAAALLLLAPAFGAVKTGDPAPPIHVKSLIPAQPVDAALEAFKGKAVVLEFWATWCGPCVDAIPHLNELVDQFAGKEIRFLSVTDEDELVVTNFLKTRPIHGLLGADPTKAMQKAYGFEGIPHTVLIGADGKVAGIVHPSQLKAAHLEDLLAGRVPKLPVMPDFSIPRDSEDLTNAPLLDMVVRRSSENRGGMSSGGTKLQMKSSTMRQLLSQAYGIPPDFVVGDPVEDPTRYDISLTAPGARPSAFHDVVPELLCLAFHVTTRKETRDIEGWTLKAPNGKPAALKESDSKGGMGQSGRGEVKITGMTLQQFAGLLRGVVHKPVADKTGIPGKFDFKVNYDEAHPESVLEVLRGLGFAVEAGVIPTEFLVVSKP